MTSLMIWRLSLTIAGVLLIAEGAVLLWMSLPADGDAGYTLGSGSAASASIGVILVLISPAIGKAGK